MRFGIGFSQGFAFAGIEIKTMSAVIYPSQNTLEQRKRKNNEKQGLQQKRLRKQNMSQQSKKCLRSTGGAADPPAFFFCRLVFPGIDAWCVTVLFRNYSIPVLLAITCDYPTTVTYFHRIICAMSKLHAILDYTGYGHPSHHGNNIEKTWFVNPIKSVWIDWLPSPIGTYVFFCWPYSA